MKAISLNSLKATALPVAALGFSLLAGAGAAQEAARTTSLRLLTAPGPVQQVSVNALETTPAPLLVVPAMEPLMKQEPPVNGEDRAIEEDNVVELVGVTDADKPGGPWWSPTGAILTVPVYDTAATPAGGLETRKDLRTLIFAFRFPAASDLTWSYELTGSQMSFTGIGGAQLVNALGPTFLTPEQWSARTGGPRIHLVEAVFPASLQRTDVHIGTASGPWTLAASTRRVGDRFVSRPSLLQGRNRFLFDVPAARKYNTPTEVKDGTILTIEMDNPDAYRILAITGTTEEAMESDRRMTLDRTGLVSAVAMQGSNRWPKGGSTHAFLQPLAQIQEFRVETRPARRIAYKDVPLQPVK